MTSFFLFKIVGLLNALLQLYIFIVIGRAVISWVNADPYNPVVRFLVQVTDPPLEYIRRYIPSMGGLDLSPMVLIFAVMMLQWVLEYIRLVLS